MKTEGCAEGTDFVHRNRHAQPGVRRRGRTGATAPCDGVGSMVEPRALSLARLAASCDASDGDWWGVIQVAKPATACGAP